MKLLATLAFLLLLPLSFLYSGISGTYKVHGGNPADGTTYTGTLVIQKVGDIYKSHWSLSNGSSTGTGVFKDGFLALNFVGFDSHGNPLAGVQLYKVGKNRIEGPWTINGEGTRGFEKGKKLPKVR